MVGRIKKTRTEQNKETLYLYQARSEWAPSLSPECLKVETWLKFNQIPYQHVDHPTLTGSANSQLPVCKVDGKEISYNNDTFKEITTAFNKDNATPTEDHIQIAFEGLIEGSLRWVLIYMRATQANQLPTGDIFQGRMQLLSSLANKILVANKLKTKADYQGIGRQNAADVIAIGKKDLRAISAYLGDKNYLAGDKPNELDATAFAHLSQFWYVPNDNELKTYMKEQCPNLVAYLERVKSEYWQDWDEKCRKPAPRRTKTKEEKEVQQENGAEKSETVENGVAEKEDEKKEGKITIESKIETVEIVNAEIPEEPKTLVTNGEKTE